MECARLWVSVLWVYVPSITALRGTCTSRVEKGTPGTPKTMIEGAQAQGSRIWLARGYRYLLGLGLHLMDLKEPLMLVMRQITAGILSPRDSRAWGESNFLLLILSCGAKGPSREWYLLCLSYLLICVF